MDRKEELHRRLSMLDREMAEIKKELRQIAEDACPIKVGMVVIYKGLEHRVTQIDRPEWNWVYGNPRKKDGTWGTATRHLLGCKPAQS